MWSFSSKIAVIRKSDARSLHQGLGGLVESFALGSTVHQDETGDSKLLAGLGHGLHPAALLQSLSVLMLFLGHDVSLHTNKILLGHSALGVDLSAVPDLAHGSSLAFLCHSLGLAGLPRGLGCFGLGGSTDGLPGGLTSGATSSTLGSTRLSGFAGNGL